MWAWSALSPFLLQSSPFSAQPPNPHARGDSAPSLLQPLNGTTLINSLFYLEFISSLES